MKREEIEQLFKQFESAAVKIEGVAYWRRIDDKGFAIIRSKGDEALFRLATPHMKKEMSVPEGRPLADFLPTVSIKAKDLAAEMTSVNLQSKDLGENKPIKKEHVANTTAKKY